MKPASAFCVVALTLALGVDGRLRGKPAAEKTATPHVASLAAPLKAEPAAKPAPTAAAVQELRGKLENLAAKLDGMVGGLLAHAKVAPALKMFAGELQSVLKETASITDPAIAMKKLEAAKAGISGLTGALTDRQETLMKEDEDQRDSLLLGVLMTKQKAPISEQLEILSSADFANLKVSEALLAKHDETMPLFQQAAAFLDKHRSHQNGTVVAKDDVMSAVAGMASALEKRVESLQKEFDVRQKFHTKKMTELSAKAATGSETAKHAAKLIMKREERNFKKFAAMRKHDIESMKSAVAAVKTGDVKAIERSRSALMESLKAMQSQTGGFLYLIQLGNTVAEDRDCPYCAAQCVDKCHNGGKSYAQCLGDCADAGK